MRNRSFTGTFHKLLLIFSFFMLVGCGSGGSDNSVSISVNPSSLHFTATQNGPLPDAQQVVATFKGEGVLVGVPTGQTVPSWIDANYTAPPTATQATFNVFITDTNLAADTYSTTLRFVTGSNATGEIDYKDVPITYVVQAEVSVAEVSLSFNSILGQVNSIPGKSIQVSGDGINWELSTDQSWLSFDTTTGTGPATVGVTVDDTGLAVGTYYATITATNTANNVTDTVAVTLIVDPPEFVLNQSSFVFAGTNGKAITGGTLNIAMNTGGAVGWTVSSDQSWLILDKTSGTTTDNLQLSVDAQTTNLTSGTHTATVSLSATVEGVPVTASVDVTLNLTAMTFTTLPSPLSVSGINGDNLGSQNISFALDTDVYDHGWTLTSNNSWLLVDASSSINGTNSGSATITVDASSLTSGSYSGSMTLQAAVNGDTITEVIDVSLSLTQATLSFDKASLTFAGINGTDLGSQTLNMSLNTSYSHPWSMVMDSGEGLSWMQSDSTSGNLNSTGVTLTMSTDETGLPGNVYPGTATVTVQVNGDTITEVVPVNLRLDPQKLQVYDNGVLLSSFPSTTSQLSHTVKVNDNAAQGVSWSAVDDATWLTVTASGTTGTNDLVLTADPAGLNTDTLHTATVTVTSADSKIENSETITVGFYVSTTDPAAIVTNSLTDPGKASDIVADPVRPYVYISHGGTGIDVYNVYTGSLVTTISSVGTDLRALTVSSDGSTLYALDYDYYNPVIAKIDLATQSLSTTFSGLGFYSCMSSCATNGIYHSIDYTRINDRAVIITSGRQILDAADGAVIGTLNDPDGLGFYSNYAPIIEASDNGKVAIIGSTGGSPFSAGKFSLSYSALEGGSFDARLTHKAGSVGSGSLSDIAVDAEGTKAYFASGGGCGTASYAFCYYNTADMTYGGELAGGAYPVSVQISPDTSIYVGIQTHPSIPADIDVKIYNDAGVMTDSLAGITAQLYHRQLELSGDGVIMISRSQRWTGSIYTNDLEFSLVKP